MRKLLILLFLTISTLGFAQDHARFTATSIEGKVTPGSIVNVIIEAEIDKDWHLYPIHSQDGPFPTTFTAGEGIEISGEIAQSETKRSFDKGFSKDIDSFEDKATFSVPVKIGAKGVDTTLSVKFQTCNNGQCTIPKLTPIPLKDAKVVDMPATPTVKPVSKVEAPPTGVNKGTGSESQDVKAAKEKGLFAYLQLAFFAGLTALLTPCVFPMIPITVSFFAKRKEEGSSPVSQAVLYCAGIIGTFTIVGIGVSILFGATGLNKLANNPWVNLGLASIFIVLALSLFGVFEIGLPTKFVNKFDSTGKKGWIAPVLMGLTFSLTSFTCTLPFVGAVLFSASQGDYIYPALGMLAFSTAFALPFFLLALFPQAMSKLPRSGAWMVTVKAFMGFIELIAAVKFLSTVDLGFGLGLITREMNLALWFLLMAMAGCYMLGWVRLPKVHDGQIGWIRRGFGILSFVGALWIGNALNGGNLGLLEGFLPPSPYPTKNGAPAAPTEGIAFLRTLEEAQAKAKETGKPIFVDFTGQYCTNCRVMERTVFTTPEVQKSVESYVPLQLYTDRSTPEDNKNLEYMLKITQSSTLPVYAVVKADGTISSRPFTPNSKEFAEWLDTNSK